MNKPIRRAALALIAVWLAGCGARASLDGDELSSGTGSGGSGGAGASSGPSGSGHGSSVSSAAHGSSSSAGSGAGSGSSASSGSSTGTTSSSASSGPGSSSASSSGSGGQLCPGFGDACTTCLSTGCPPTYCACYNNPDCLAIFSCSNACKGDKKCDQGCLTMHPSGISEAYLLSDCASTTCAAACPGNAQVDPCTKCLFEDCAAAMNACLAEPECLDLYNCLDPCGSANLACQQACYQAHGGGVPTLQAVLQCSQNQCAPACT